MQKVLNIYSPDNLCKHPDGIFQQCIFNKFSNVNYFKTSAID